MERSAMTERWYAAAASAEGGAELCVGVGERSRV